MKLQDVPAGYMLELYFTNSALLTKHPSLLIFIIENMDNLRRQVFQSVAMY